MNLSYITDELAVSGRLTAADIPALKSYGVTSVLNVGWPDEPDAGLIQSEFKYLDLTTMDDGQPKPSEWFDAGVKFYRERPEGVVLVHCGHGINRSPAMAYAILRSEGMPPVAAEALVREKRKQAGSGLTGSWFDIYIKSADAR